MKNLGIMDNIQLEDDEMLGALAFDEEMEHSYLDNIMQEMDVETVANMEDKLEGENMASSVATEDILTPHAHADTEDTLAVTSGSNIMRSGPVRIDTTAYSTGTWWLNNWVNNSNTQVESRVSTCKNMLGCACNSTEMEIKSNTRIIKPISGDCTLGRVNFKRSRNEMIVWSVSGTKRFDNTRSRRGSMPRKCLTARRRKLSPAGDPPSTPPGVYQDSAADNSNAGKLFGGSGAKFASLRNRRGVRGGEDGRVQTKLMLRVSNDGNGKFSLFTSGLGGVRAGKRPAEIEENTSEKKLKF